MARQVHRLALSLAFPAGLAPGDGKWGNTLLLARDGRDRAVLRGTSVAGALRHAWATSKRLAHRDTEVQRWFGRALEDTRHAPPSPLRVCDCLIATGEAASSGRSHNAIDRHTGAALDKGLFQLEALPPGSAAELVLWLHDDGPPAEARQFLAEVVALLRSGLTLGGHAARGIGLVKLSGSAQYRHFDCTELASHAAYLDEDRAWRGTGALPSEGEDLARVAPADEVLVVDLVLTVPRAEDLLVGDGQGFDCEIEPQRARHADGTERWRLPGSALRGVFRSWVTRLAARAGRPVADSQAREAARRLDGTALTGGDLAWGFDDDRVRKEKQKVLAEDPDALDELVPCPIMRLFGSSYSKGRLHVSDALSRDAIQKNGQARVQRRSHVAVDRITGGATEGFFFDSAVLVGQPMFPVSITVKRVTEEEAKWLAATLRALHLGILRVGSSKAGGRLVLAEHPQAKGPQHELFTALDPTEV